MSIWYYFLKPLRNTNLFNFYKPLVSYYNYQPELTCEETKAQGG